MKITIRPLPQIKADFVVEAEPSETIRELKLKISTDQGHPFESRKIFKSGICLQDDKTIGSYNINDASRLGLILKGAPAGSVSSSGVSSPRTTTALPLSASSPFAYTPAYTPQALAPRSLLAGAPRSLLAGAPRSLLAGAPRSLLAGVGRTPGGSRISSNVGASQSNVDKIMNMGMGFTEERVIHALRASFDDPDRAIEILLDESVAVSTAPRAQAPNLPENLYNVPRARAPGPSSSAPRNPPQSTPQRQLGGPYDVGDTSFPCIGDDAAAMGIDPAQIYEIRRMVAENPALTGPLIESIRATDPEGAAHLSTSDPDGIIRFFNPTAPIR